MRFRLWIWNRLPSPRNPRIRHSLAVLCTDDHIPSLISVTVTSVTGVIPHRINTLCPQVFSRFPICAELFGHFQICHFTALFSARYSAASIPTIPPPITTTLPDAVCVPGPEHRENSIRTEDLLPEYSGMIGIHRTAITVCGVDFLDQLRRHRCIQANFHTPFFCLMRHRDHCLFHLFLLALLLLRSGHNCPPRRSVASLQNPADVLSVFNTIAASVRRFAACDQYRLRFLLRQDSHSFSLPTADYKTGDIRTIGIGKSIQTSLITSTILISSSRPSFDFVTKSDPPAVHVPSRPYHFIRFRISSRKCAVCYVLRRSSAFGLFTDPCCIIDIASSRADQSAVLKLFPAEIYIST